MGDIASGRVETLQANIIDSMARCYQKMGWYTWRAVFSELLKDVTIREALKRRGIHVTEKNYRAE